VCEAHAGRATVHEQSRDWSTALPIKQQILPDFLCPPFPVQPGRREGNGSFLCESPELPQPALSHLSSTSRAQTRAAHSSAGPSLAGSVCTAAYLFIFPCVWLFLSTCSASVEGRGEKEAVGRWSSDGRQRWLCLGLGMLTRGREGLFELGQQLQQQGEYQAALHCFLSCLLGLTHVQSFTYLPNCLHQVSQMPEDWAHTHTHTFVYLFIYWIPIS